MVKKQKKLLKEARKEARREERSKHLQQVREEPKVDENCICICHGIPTNFVVEPDARCECSCNAKATHVNIIVPQSKNLRSKRGSCLVCGGRNTSCKVCTEQSRAVTALSVEMLGPLAASNSRMHLIPDPSTKAINTLESKDNKTGSFRQNSKTGSSLQR